LSLPENQRIVCSSHIIFYFITFLFYFILGCTDDIRE
jgi:hypothetical protein